MEDSIKDRKAKVDIVDKEVRDLIKVRELKVLIKDSRLVLQARADLVMAQDAITRSGDYPTLANGLQLPMTTSARHVWPLVQSLVQILSSPK